MRVRIDRNVPVSVARRMRKLADWLRKCGGVDCRRHKLSVLISSASTVSDGIYSSFGVFVYSRKRSHVPAIIVATGVCLLRKEYGFSLKEVLESVELIFAHEWVHFWQWSQRGVCTERGVSVRAKGLLRRYIGGVDEVSGVRRKRKSSGFVPRVRRKRAAGRSKTSHRA